MVIHKIIVTIAICLFSLGAQAQDSLSNAQRKEIMLRAEQKKEEFLYALNRIVDNQLNSNTRKEYVANLLNLFIGEGEAYDYYDVDLDKRVHSTGVKMQTSSIYRTNIQSQKLKRYIYRLYNPETGRSSLPYTKIDVQAVDIIVPFEFTKRNVPYKTAAYVIPMVINNGNEKGCWDIGYSKKRIGLFTEPLSITLSTGERILDAKLGNIYVTTNHKL